MRHKLGHLLALSAGGVIGSGWLLHRHVGTHHTHGSWGLTILPWLIGGAATLVFAVVMVESSLVHQQTGGLVLRPARVFGYAFGGAIAAALWVAYLLTPAAQGIAVAKSISVGIGKSATLEQSQIFTAAVAVLVIVAISLMVLLPERLLLRAVLWITGAKMLALIGIAGYFTRHHTATSLPVPTTVEPGSVVGVVLATGIVFAFLGFQAPLDFVGDVDDAKWPLLRWFGQRARVRTAVYATVISATALYCWLEYVYSRGCGVTSTGTYLTCVSQIRAYGPVLAVSVGIISPVGSGLIFMYAITYEARSFVRDHLIHHGLLEPATQWRQMAGRYDPQRVAKIVAINAGFSSAGVILFVLFWKSDAWSTIAAVQSVPFVIVYAISGVVWSVEQRATQRKQTARQRPMRLGTHIAGMLAFSTATLSIVFNEDELRNHAALLGCLAVGLGTVTLVSLPLLFKQTHRFIHWDAAKMPQTVAQLRQDATPALPLLGGYLITVLVMAYLRQQLADSSTPLVLLGAVAVVVGAIAYWALIVVAQRRMSPKIFP